MRKASPALAQRVLPPRSLQEVHHAAAAYIADRLAHVAREARGAADGQGEGGGEGGGGEEG